MDVIVNDCLSELPRVMCISHHIDLILGASFPNKASYKMETRENEENRNQVQDLLDKGLVRETLSPCVVPTFLIPKKDGGW